MKKNIILILCIIIIAALGGSCGYLYRNYQASRQDLSEAQSEIQQQTQEISDLQAALEEKNTYIQGQADYVTELTEQVNTLAGFGTESSVDGDAKDESSSYDDSDNETSYQEKYPDLYAQAEYDKRKAEAEKENNTEKMVYLTFDDGPSNLTPKVLDLLDEYNAKATFFVVYKEEKEYTDYLSEIVKRGHTLALHSYSHDYKKIYASVDAFLADFQKVYDWVYEETGQRPTLFRFPGGSTNGKKAITDEIVAEMQRRGFIYYDWNVSSGDGSNLATTENIIENITTTVGGHDLPVVLMHDGAGKYPTLEALPTVLEFLQNKGYSFGALDETMTPVQYSRKGREK